MGLAVFSKLIRVVSPTFRFLSIKYFAFLSGQHTISRAIVSAMKKRTSLMSRIAALKVGQIITVATHKERQNAHQIALRSGIGIKTKSRWDSDGFEIKRVA